MYHERCMIRNCWRELPEVEEEPKEFGGAPDKSCSMHKVSLGLQATPMSNLSTKNYREVDKFNPLSRRHPSPFQRLTSQILLEGGTGRDAVPQAK